MRDSDRFMMLSSAKTYRDAAKTDEKPARIPGLAILHENK
jgi:hypothetical protein